MSNKNKRACVQVSIAKIIISPDLSFLKINIERYTALNHRPLIF